MTLADKEELTRFGVSFPAPLIEQFDEYIGGQGYTNRSEAIRDLVRKALLDPSRMDSEQAVAGTIVMVYDHHVNELQHLLTELQHGYHHDIVSTMHVHLNHDQCLEVIVVRGRLSRLRALHQQLQVLKGVAYAELSVTYADQAHAPEAHAHEAHAHEGHAHEGHAHESDAREAHESEA
ncbi:nickel-responsive transcriptional regulator NikR [Paenibacillus sp. IB182496]|uniref:Putative nickel-responsive regulator n=1 Tax=Paenibacillus sabuli TaxID=2772509 RepID=A0A927BP68_9BACL|nr:nickel-responsive transcriptional regulator NikR [Paenibacillus sabuli]MBD2844166.1 nickel-responsive transcriptional regulator NikR [Paenibacillus sabuli]